MAKRETQFSKYANAFYDILYERRCNRDAFVKELLKTGLLDEGKHLIETLFPSVLSSKGKKVIESEKADVLRKYLRGENDISEPASEIKDYFNKDLYAEALMNYETRKLKEFADKLGLCKNKKSSISISKELAKFHKFILDEAAEKKNAATKKSNNVSDQSNSIVCSYIITAVEKSALNNLCGTIMQSLKVIKQLTDAIDQKQFELEKLTTSREDKRWKKHVESDLSSLRAKLNEQYSLLETAGPDAVKLLEPKKHLHPSLERLYNIAIRINENVYKSTCPEFSYAAFSVMIADFRKAHEQLRKHLDAL